MNCDFDSLMSYTTAGSVSSGQTVGLKPLTVWPSRFLFLLGGGNWDKYSAPGLVMSEWSDEVNG